jgi:hypothetical protein
MPLPTQDCGPVETADLCCTTLWDLANGVLATVVPFMEDCIVPVECAPAMRYFVSIGRPETWQSDFLALYLENIRLDQSSQRNLSMLTSPIILGQFRFLLTESGYPGLVQVGEEFYTPNDDTMHLASSHGYSHAQAMLRGLLSYAGANDCKKFLLRDLQPTRPEAGHAGWTLGFDLELPN